MAGKLSRSNLLLCVLVAAMASPMVVNPVVCRKVQHHNHVNTHKPTSVAGAKQDSSSLCSPSCSTPSKPSHGGSYGSPTTPSHGSGYGTPTPSHHGGGGHGTPATPSHGGGYYSPPNGDGSTPSPVTEPSTPTPTTPYTPEPTTPSTPSYTPTPATPYTPYTPEPTTPSTPSYTPTPIDPYTPYTPTPTTPTPGISTPSVPGYSLTPYFTGTCDYWRTHPQVIWGMLGGYWGTLGGLLGTTGSPAGGLGVMAALRNTRTDGVGALYREGTAAFLNSMVNQRFPFTAHQVRDAFTAALASDQAAANQARVFRSANEGRLMH